MTEATLLKGNSTPETFRVNDNATSATRTVSIQGAVQLCKEISCLVPLLNPSSPRTLRRWRAMRSYTNSMRLAFNSGRVTQECEKIYSANIFIRSFFLKTIKAMIKHFKNILTLIYQTF